MRHTKISYGRVRKQGIFYPIPRCIGDHSAPPPSSKVFHTHSHRCTGCPYPQHGLTCHSQDGSCLRNDMIALEEKWKQEREKNRSLKEEA